ncbi:hypothetical protein SELR_04810 [Selenomonas ruminantium subsp. lactilytica TAM6421]|uniref:Uncharacterized protein n=1 Tax=Selenomonas ruminantium subsp. lactilytica (strain NBRC 103574 / TAM6421) TaxID=927704 RepID=I0GN52_SELRL|nr:hypothetical protein SELR_04810 [Selenomonas ruminantium subsp. lactilytica TAM6421]
MGKFNGISKVCMGLCIRFLIHAIASFCGVVSIFWEAGGKNL